MLAGQKGGRGSPSAYAGGYPHPPSRPPMTREVLTARMQDFRITRTRMESPPGSGQGTTRTSAPPPSSAGGRAANASSVTSTGHVEGSQGILTRAAANVARRVDGTSTTHRLVLIGPCQSPVKRGPSTGDGAARRCASHRHATSRGCPAPAVSRGPTSGACICSAPACRVDTAALTGQVPVDTSRKDVRSRYERDVFTGSTADFSVGDAGCAFVRITRSYRTTRPSSNLSSASEGGCNGFRTSSPGAVSACRGVAIRTSMSLNGRAVIKDAITPGRGGTFNRERTAGNGRLGSRRTRGRAPASRAEGRPNAVKDGPTPASTRTNAGAAAPIAGADRHPKTGCQPNVVTVGLITANGRTNGANGVTATATNGAFHLTTSLFTGYDGTTAGNFQHEVEDG